MILCLLKVNRGVPCFIIVCCSLQISYAIGVSHPLSISVFHYGTSTRDEDELLQIVQKNFDLRPGVIVKYV